MTLEDSVADAFHINSNDYVYNSVYLSVRSSVLSSVSNSVYLYVWKEVRHPVSRVVCSSGYWYTDSMINDKIKSYDT
jgi:hypothetical protein